MVSGTVVLFDPMVSFDPVVSFGSGVGADPCVRPERDWHSRPRDFWAEDREPIKKPVYLTPWFLKKTSVPDPMVLFMDR